MTLQTTVFALMGFGVPGEIFLDGPTRAQPGIIDSAGVDPNFNRVGRVFTNAAAADGHCSLGGSGVFFGILANPKVYPLRGTVGDTLAASLDLPQYAEAEFVYDTTGIIVTLPAAANIGDEVLYDTTSGIVSTQPANYPSSGAQRVAIVAATGVATVTLAPAGMPPIGPGSVLTAADGQVLTVTNVLTGTGANGTYTTVGSTADHAAQAFTLTKPAVASGKARVPGFQVVRYNTPSAGLAVVGNIN